MSKVSKVWNPKAWYLVGAGAVALAADGARRLMRRRRASGSAGFGSTEAPTAMAEQEAPAATKARSTATPKAKKAPATSDDLTQIKGIGPAFAKRLNEAGYTTYADLANASADALREATHAPAMANPDEWIAGARELL